MRRDASATVGCLAALVLVSVTDEAQPGPVVLQVESAAEQRAASFVTQLKLELAAGRFAVVDPSVEGPAPDAVVDVSLQDGNVLARLVVPLSDGFVVRELRMSLDEPNGPFLFSVKVRELLHGTALDLASSRALNRNPRPLDDAELRAFDAASKEPAAKRADEPWIELALGPAVIGGSDIAAGFAPGLVLSVRAARRMYVEAFAVGPSHVRVDDVSGGADVDQEVFAFRLRLEPWSMRHGAPFLTLGSGLHTMGVDGEAEPGFVAASDRTWSSVFVAGLGYRHGFAQMLGLYAEVDAVTLSSPPTIEFDGRPGGRAGNPLLLGFVGLHARF